MNEAGGDESEGDGDVACACWNETLRNGLINERLIGADDVLGGRLNVVEADLLWKL